MTDFDERHGQLVRVVFERSYLLQNPYFDTKVQHCTNKNTRQQTCQTVVKKAYGHIY